MLPACVYCIPKSELSGERIRIVRFGIFRRSSDNQLVQRYRCQNCKKTFSDAGASRCYNQKKRQLNPQVFMELCSGVSQRRAAMKLKTNRKTIARKLVFLGEQAESLLTFTNGELEKCKIVEFDDMETFEHTKCKPLAVTIAIEHKSRRILGVRVASMPAKGHLAKIAIKKYGYRIDERSKKRRELFEELKSIVSEDALFKSDMHTAYPADLKRSFPNCKHTQYKSRKACVTGQGQVKEGKFDPLFSLNQSYAMIRASVSRLFRRTWNTTKRPDRLRAHIMVYAVYHNLHLIHNTAR